MGWLSDSKMMALVIVGLPTSVGLFLTWYFVC